MNYYELCSRHIGKEVCIYDKLGRQYVGKIVNVDRRFVYVQPTRRTYRGFGYGYWPGYFGYGGYGYGGYGYGGIVPIALAAIAGLVLLSAFFW